MPEIWALTRRICSIDAFRCETLTIAQSFSIMRVLRRSIALESDVAESKIGGFGL